MNNVTEVPRLGSGEVEMESKLHPTPEQELGEEDGWGVEWGGQQGRTCVTREMLAMGSYINQLFTWCPMISYFFYLFNFI